jgi:uncharacterized protein YabE (DUF348 family)
VTESAAQHKTVTYFVNGEEQTTTSDKLTVQEILTNAGFTPAEEYRLTRDEGSHVYHDYDEEVPLHEGERFTVTFLGPTPTS